MAKKESQFEFPHVFAFMFMIVVVMAALTWVIPAGEYDRVKQGTITKVVAGTYHPVKANPQGIWEIFAAVPKGWLQTANLIFLVFFVGAAVQILEQTGTIRAGMTKVVKGLKGRELFGVFIVMGLLSMMGAIGLLASAIVALVPIGVALSKALGYDEVVGFAMFFLGVFAGFNVGWANIFTVGLAHSVAELPMFSGMEVRMLFHAVNLLLSFGFVALYCKRIKADPTQSLTYYPGKVTTLAEPSDVQTETMTNRQIASGVIALIGFSAIIFGAIKLKWGIAQFPVVFFMMSVATGLASGLGVSGTAEAFVKGCANMAFPAFIIGMARAISVVMIDGKIIDTVVYYLAIPISHMGPVLGANLMLEANNVINFFISSSTGQAVTVMPIMIPLADITGITRQIATQAFQFGGGFADCIIPTCGPLMGSLAIAGISYQKYVKWFFPFLLVQLVLAHVAITVLQIMKWGPA